MARNPRLTVPGHPHHVTQRGNRCQPTFFSDHDYRLYMHYLSEACRLFGVDVWAYCLMPNHVHLVMVPSTEFALTKAVADTHERYTKAINHRFAWQGHLWQGRFFSVVMDELHLAAAVRYVELNPVRAGLTTSALDYPWSSARAHASGQNDGLVNVAPMISRVGDWQDYLGDEQEVSQIELLRLHTRTGRPLGNACFTSELETMIGRALAPKRRGRKPENRGQSSVPELAPA